jgi:glycosyltransferase involved in cell wall biosynthesis
MKKFSIIIPSYNEEGRIGDLLKSIENLDYPKNKFEVIVVNDGSTDRTKNVVLQFPFVKLVDLKENRGRFIARKIGS